MPELTAEPRHQSGGLAVALAKLNLDALTVADAVADVAATAGENVTTAIRADIKELAGSIQSLHREVAHAPLDDRDRLHPAEYLPRSLNVPPHLVGLCSGRGRGPMSTDDQQKRGGLVPIGDVAVRLPGIEGRGRAMSARARHHFTLLKQVNQLIEAGEGEPDLGFMARLLALCSLPRTNPRDRLQYERSNGPYKLCMIAGSGKKLPLRQPAASAPGVGLF